MSNKVARYVHIFNNQVLMFIQFIDIDSQQRGKTRDVLSKRREDLPSSLFTIAMLGVFDVGSTGHHFW